MDSGSTRTPGFVCRREQPQTIKRNESVVEDAALTWFGELGYSCRGAEALTPALSHGERESYSDVVLVGRPRGAIRRLKPAIPEDAREEALRKVLRLGAPSLAQTNRAFHWMLQDGVEVEYARPEGSIAGDHVRLVDFDDVQANDWLVVNQSAAIEGQPRPAPPGNVGDPARHRWRVESDVWQQNAI